MKDKYDWYTVLLCAIGLACVLFINGCAVQGTIIGKYIEPAHNETNSFTICQPVGKVTFCRPQYYESYVGERYHLVVQPEEGQSSDVTVDKWVYDSVEVGQPYNSKEHE